MGTPRKGLLGAGAASRGSAPSSPSFLMNNFPDSSPFPHGLALPWPPARDAIPRDAGEGQEKKKGLGKGENPKKGVWILQGSSHSGLFVGFPDILKGFCAWILWDSSLPHGNSAFSVL